MGRGKTRSLEDPCAHARAADSADNDASGAKPSTRRDYWLRSASPCGQTLGILRYEVGRGTASLPDAVAMAARISDHSAAVSVSGLACSPRRALN